MISASLIFSLMLTVYLVNQLVKIKIDKRILAGPLTASAMMAAAMLTLQQAYQGQHVLLFSVLADAAIYITLIRIQKTLDREDLELLRQVTGAKLANYALKLLGYKPTPTQANL